MVKLIGPLCSLEARGALAETLIYARVGMTSYAKAYAVPTNPQTQPQTSIRIAITAITQAWQTLADYEKSTWQELADLWNLSPYHAYLRYNTQRWPNNLLPQQRPTTDPSLLYETYAFNITPEDTYYDFYVAVADFSPAPFALQIIADTDDPPNYQRQNTIVLNCNPITIIPGYYYYNARWYPPSMNSYYFLARVGTTHGISTEWLEPTP